MRKTKHIRQSIYLELEQLAYSLNLPIADLPISSFEIAFKNRSGTEVYQFTHNHSDIFDKIKDVFIPF